MAAKQAEPPKVAPPVVPSAKKELTIEERLARLEELEAERWKVLENFLSRFGLYYNMANTPAFFIVDRLLNSGAAGVAITPYQGLVDHMELRMRTKPVDTEKGEKVTEPYWVPFHIPEKVEKAIELFEGAADGDNSQADS